LNRVIYLNHFVKKLDSTFIYGPESSGKTTLTLAVIAEAQKQGETCAFVDAERALDPACN